MPTTDELVSLYNSRKRATAARMATMLEVRDAYEGRLDVPLPELDKNERPMVANLVAQGLDQKAMRIASTLPNVICPPVRPGIDVSEGRARDRRGAILTWWDLNRMGRILRQRARHLVAYGISPVVIRPDFERSVPMWQWRDPITTLSPPGDDLAPPYCLFTFHKTYRWLTDNFPDATRALYTGRDRPAPDASFQILEYLDDADFVWIALGAEPDPITANQSSSAVFTPGGARFVELRRFDNRAGICPVVVPSRLGLGLAQGELDGLLGVYWQQAKVMALATIAATRDIFPDEYLVDGANQSATMVEADGLRGEIGHISGGTLESTHKPIGQMTLMLADRLERAIRVGGGIPAEFGGESPSNVRTARRGQAVLSSTVDFDIQEAQELLSDSLEEENHRAVAVAKAYFPGQRSFYYSWSNQSGRGSYDTAATFETDENSVSYPYPGANLNELVIGGGQRLGMETMSKRRFMEIDPYVEDPVLEHARVIGESLEKASLTGLQQAAASGSLPPADLARITELVVAKRKTLYEAIQTAHDEAQTRQASSGAPGTPEGPVAPGAPEAQPGLAAPGQGAEAASTPIGPGPPALGNLSMLLANLRRPQRGSPAAVGGPPGA